MRGLVETETRDKGVAVPAGEAQRVLRTHPQAPASRSLPSDRIQIANCLHGSQWSQGWPGPAWEGPPGLPTERGPGVHLRR